VVVALVVKAEQQVMNGLQSKMITQEAEVVGAAAVVEGAEDAAEAEDEIKTGWKKIRPILLLLGERAKQNRNFVNFWKIQLPTYTHL
jgi:hypothetical protein